MAVVNDAPKNLRMSDFLSQSLMFGSFQKSCRFAVRINPTGAIISKYRNLTRDFTYLCETADLPGRSFDAIPIRYYGPQEYFPIMSNYNESSAGFTFLCRNEAFEREFFDSWMALINPPNTFDFTYRDDYKCEIDIYQFTDAGKDESNGWNPQGWKKSMDPVANYKITLINAWPITLANQPLNWSDDQFSRLTVTFSYVKWIRKGIDRQDSTGSNYDYSLMSTRGVER